MSVLDEIVAHGNRGHGRSGIGPVQCADGFTVSVIAGGGTYCLPRPVMCFHSGDFESFSEPDMRITTVAHDYPGPYTHVEVGFPSQRPEPWDIWAHHAEDPDQPCGTVYARVPVGLVRDLVAAHGGEVGTDG